MYVLTASRDKLLSDTQSTRVLCLHVFAAALAPLVVSVVIWFTLLHTMLDADCSCGEHCRKCWRDETMSVASEENGKAADEEAATDEEAAVDEEAAADEE